MAEKLRSLALSDVALKILRARYFLRNRSGQIIETPEELFCRVAKAIAAPEKKSARKRWEKEFFDLMSTLRFLPNSPTLMNAGCSSGQLSACFVLPIEDDLGQVFETLKNSALIHKTGGGTGFGFGKIRPVGDAIESLSGVACGPVAFLEVFDHATQVVKQGGKRRGANMAVLPDWHPDIEAFVDCKLTGGVQNFNISVGISDNFMKALMTNKSWVLRDPKTKQKRKTLQAQALWKKIAKAAWATGDPGLVFLDKVNKVNPTPKLGRMQTTNPCGELPLLDFESCNLGSINLTAYQASDDLNWDRLEKDIYTCVRFLDNVIDANAYPLRQIEAITKANRKIGLGVMGWGDLLIAWNIPYDSEKAIRKANEVMGRIQRTAVKASQLLAKERGAFPNFKDSRWSKLGYAKRRNATVTTIAPTGTISLIAGVSSGIEPVFSLAHERIGLEGERFWMLHPRLKQVLKEFRISKKDKAEILRTGSVAKVKKISLSVRQVLKAANEIDPKWHVKMQAQFQKHTENAVSKTINLPRSATPKQIEKIYTYAYEKGCKGITVFRDRSKPSQVLRSGSGVT